MNWKYNVFWSACRINLRTGFAICMHKSLLVFVFSKCTCLFWWYRSHTANSHKLSDGENFPTLLARMESHFRIEYLMKSLKLFHIAFISFSKSKFAQNQQFSAFWCCTITPFVPLFRYCGWKWPEAIFWEQLFSNLFYILWKLHNTGKQLETKR